MPKNEVSPYWKYYIVPIEDSETLFYIKRESKIKKDLVIHDKRYGLFSSYKDEVTEEDPNIEWLTDYNEKWSWYIRSTYHTQYRINNSKHRKYFCNDMTAEAIIKNSIQTDLFYEKQKMLQETYEQRVIENTREVPPYKFANKKPPKPKR